MYINNAYPVKNHTEKLFMVLRRIMRIYTTEKKRGNLIITLLVNSVDPKLMSLICMPHLFQIS